MRILHVSTHDIRGGAARSAYRLHGQLRQMGHDSQMMVAHRQSDDADVFEFQPKRDPASWLARKVRRRMIHQQLAPYRDRLPPAFDIFTMDQTKTGAEPLDALPRCDVINLHWIATMIDHESFLPAAAALPRSCGD